MKTLLQLFAVVAMALLCLGGNRAWGASGSAPSSSSGSGGSATNAVSQILTNGAVVGNAITELDFIGATGQVSGARAYIGGFSGGSGGSTQFVTASFGSLNFTNSLNTSNVLIGSGNGIFQISNKVTGNLPFYFQWSDDTVTIAALNGTTASFGTSVTTGTDNSDQANIGSADVRTNLNVNTLRITNVTASSVLRSTADGTVSAVTIGSGLSFNGTTLSATGGAGSTNFVTATFGSGDVTNGWSVGSLSVVGSGVGSQKFYDNSGSTYAAIEAPFAVQTNSVLRWLSNATAGVIVAQPIATGTNQAQAVALTAGQYVTYNGSTYVASNLPIVTGLSITNPSTSVATNATSFTADFTLTPTYEMQWHLTTNIVISPTNLVTGRTIAINFPTNSLTYDVAVTNTAGNAVHWNFNVATNGSTAVTKTNTLWGRLFLTCSSNSVLYAEWGYYR